MITKLIIAFLFLAFSTNIRAQDTLLLTPEQMKEDADFYFETLYKRHPNPYYFYPMEEFEKKKNSIYSRLE